LKIWKSANPKMARHRTPTSLLELSGSAKKNAARMKRQGRDSEPKPDPNFGDPPARLTESQRTLWLELVDQIPGSVITKSDRWLVELAVRLQEKIITGVALGSDVSNLNRCLSQLGLTPADRSKVHATSPDTDEQPADPFADFLPNNDAGSAKPN
jgi:hypothetical protein